jgi:type IV secretory pathway TraG/TraD family ATPase VirD4
LRYPDVRKNYLKRGASKYWDNFDKYRPGGREPDEVITAKRIAVRLNKFVNDDRFRRIVTGENQLDIADIAQNRRVIVVDASGMSTDKRVYITSLFSFAMKSYCEFQKQEKEHPLMFYLDECWMGINDSFDYLLSFARSFKIGLTLAHQNISQFADQKTVKRIVSNCNTKVSFFPAGNEEARMLAEIYGLEQEDFRTLDKYQAWVRIGNMNSLIKTYPPPKPESLAVPGEIAQAEPERAEPPAVNFLRDCWFTC